MNVTDFQMLINLLKMLNCEDQLKRPNPAWGASVCILCSMGCLLIRGWTLSRSSEQTEQGEPLPPWQGGQAQYFNHLFFFL